MEYSNKIWPYVGIPKWYVRTPKRYPGYSFIVPAVTRWVEKIAYSKQPRHVVLYYIFT